MNWDAGSMLELLEKQHEILSGLLQIEHEKRVLILKGPPEELDALVTSERKEIARLSQIEKKRALLAAPIAGVFGVPEQELTISVMVENSDEELKDQLLRLQKDLVAVTGALTEINALNKELLEAQLEFTEIQLNLFVGTEDPINNLYGGDGKADVELRRSAGLFDKQI